MMAGIQLKFLLICVCILLSNEIKGVSGQCTTPPINLAGYEGTLNTVLPCNSPTKVSWTLKPTSDELTNYKLTNYDDVVDARYANLFGVNSTGLIVKKDQTTPVTPPISTSGLFVANINGSTTTKYGAKLLVVRLGPNCTCTADNATIQMNCSITYADSAYHPVDAVMNWTSNGDFYQTDTPTRTRPNKKEFISSSILQVNATDESDYECTVTFAVPRDPQFPYVATNAPAFSASCHSPCGKVQATSTSATKPATTTTPETTTTTPTTTTLPTTTPEPTTTTPPTTTTEPTTTTPTTITPEPTTTTPPTTTPEPITTTLPSTDEESTTTFLSATTTFPTDCTCSQMTDCPTPGPNCVRTNECQSDGTNATDVYSECVVKAELYARCDKCCSEDLICGVVVTLRNDSRWLIYDPQCDDNKCEMVVVSASCMSSDWKPLSERKITISGVGNYVQTGHSVQLGLNVTDCSDSCKRMMSLP